MHPRNFGCDVSVRPPVHSLGGGKGIRCQPVGGGGGRMLHFLGGKSCDAFVQPADFLGGKSRKKWRGHCRRIQKLIYFRYFFSSRFQVFDSIRIF